MIWKQEELEKASCDFCGARTAQHKFTRADGMRVAECPQCGLAYLDPRPRQEFISRFYDADYFTGVSADRGDGGLRCRTAGAGPTGDDDEAPRCLELIKARLDGISGRDILEIGCATGTLLSWLKREGASARGLELSDYAAGIARSRGLDVTTGTIETMKSAGRRLFDMIIAFEVIEHVARPALFLQEVAGHIRPGGHLLLSTPNYACSQRYGEHWAGFTGSFEHLYFFSKDVLERMAEPAGLQLTYWETSTVSGDTSRRPGFLERQGDRIARLASISKEAGLLRAVSLALRRSLNFFPYGNGHTLFVVLTKAAGEQR